MNTPVTVKTVITVKTTSDSDSHLLSQPYKGAAVTVNLKARCCCCQYWAGTPESIMAYCTLPKAGIMFTVTGRNASCARYEAEMVTDASHDCNDTQTLDSPIQVLRSENAASSRPATSFAKNRVD
jgi:hypothetical protein